MRMFKAFALLISVLGIISVSSSHTLAETKVTAKASTTGLKTDLQGGGNEWVFSTPTALDTIRFTSGEHDTDGTIWPKIGFGPWQKFNLGPPITGAFRTWTDPVGPGPKGSTAGAAGSFASDTSDGLFWGTNYYIGWNVFATGTEGPVTGAYFKSRARGRDPFSITPGQLAAAGVTGPWYDVFFAVGLESGDFTAKGKISLEASYETSSARIDVLSILIDDTGVQVFSSAPVGTKFYRLSSIDEGPTEDPLSLIDLAALRSELAADVGGDDTISTPLYIGIVLDRLAVPTADLGDGSVAKVKIESMSYEDEGITVGPVQNVQFLGGAIVLTWDTLAGAASYDVIAGDLGTLRSTHGDYSTATQRCVVNDTANLGAVDVSLPAASGGYFYIVRANGVLGGSGSYDDGPSSQVGWRDEEIEAAAGACE